jgi:hypothetical protein
VGQDDRDELPPFRWLERYDLAAVVVGLLLGIGLVAVGASVIPAIAVGAGSVPLIGFALRRLAGVPQVTLWQRAKHRRRRRR